MVGPHDNPVEARRQVVQAELDARRPEAERNRLGQFATPNALAVEITRYVQALASGSLPAFHFADPSIGTGSFYSAALTVFGAGRIERAVGVELDPAFCDAARALWGDAGLEVVRGDFTQVVASDERPPSPNLILANPPYVRHHHLKREDKLRLQALVRQMTGVEIHGLAGLYVYFLLLATAWMEDGGYAAWLIPSEFMDVNYGAALKRYLTDRITLIRVHRFDPDDMQFGDALVSSAVLTLRKTAPPSEHVVEFSFGGALGAPHSCESIPVGRLRESRKWTAYPGHARNDRRTSADEKGPTLGDFFRIRRGIATGSNQFFILERAEAERRRFPDQYLRPILPSPRRLQTTVIEPDPKGYPLLDRPLCVIDCDLPEGVLKERHPPLWDYLQTAEQLGVRHGYLVGKRTPWYKQERREPAPFLCTYMGAAPMKNDPSGSSGIARGPSARTSTSCFTQGTNWRRCCVDTPPAADVFALLGEVTGQELRGEGRVYGGGLNKIEPNELARISATPFVQRWPELEPAAQRQTKLFD